MSEFGTIYIVSTPIGNLGDMTYRAVGTLKNVDLIVAEDTRRTMKLLNYFEIKNSLIANHEHNEFEKADEIIEKVKLGKNVAIVTDAGTPIVSDPGNVLVKRAIEENIVVTAVPGACAAINALVLSGLDATSFVFVGFLSENNKKRAEQLDIIKVEKKTMIIYISPHNLLSDIKDLIKIFGSVRKVALTREMTKKFEEVMRGPIGEIYDNISLNEVLGEFVLVVEGNGKVVLNNEPFWKDLGIKEHYNYYIDSGYDEKVALKQVAIDRNIDKREVYKIVKC